MHRFRMKAARNRAAAASSERPHRVPHVPLDLPPDGTLGERRSKQILAHYGIPVVRELLIAEDAIDSLGRCDLAFPLAVKIESPDIAHKTEAGAVRLHVADLGALKQAAREVLAAARRYRPDARIEGVLAQEMARGTEVIVGAIDDPHFGPTVMVGLGGVLTEILHDVTHRFAPFDHAAAQEMLLELKGAALWEGYRGAAPLDTDALADALVRIGWLIQDHAGRIREIDVNPLFVRARGEGVVAADALVVLHESR